MGDDERKEFQRLYDEFDRKEKKARIKEENGPGSGNNKLDLLASMMGVYKAQVDGDDTEEMLKQLGDAGKESRGSMGMFAQVFTLMHTHFLKPTTDRGREDHNRRMDGGEEQMDQVDQMDTVVGQSAIGGEKKRRRRTDSELLLEQAHSFEADQQGGETIGDQIEGEEAAEQGRGGGSDVRKRLSLPANLHTPLKTSKGRRQEASDDGGGVSIGSANTEQQAKKKRGRPFKTPQKIQEEPDTEDRLDAGSTGGEKKGRGRPRKRAGSSPVHQPRSVSPTHNRLPPSTDHKRRRTVGGNDVLGERTPMKQSAAAPRSSSSRRGSKRFWQILDSPRLQKARADYDKNGLSIEQQKAIKQGGAKDSSGRERWACVGSYCHKSFDNHSELYTHMLHEHYMEGAIIAKCTDCGKVDGFAQLIIHRKAAGDEGRCGQMQYWIAEERMEDERQMSVEEKEEYKQKKVARKLAKVLRSCLVKECSQVNRDLGGYERLARHCRHLHNCWMVYICRRCCTHFTQPLAFIRHRRGKCAKSYPKVIRRVIKKGEEAVKEVKTETNEAENTEKTTTAEEVDENPSRCITS